MKNKVNKFKILFPFTISISILFISIGYSAFSSKLYIAGDAAVRVAADIRVSGITVGNMINGATVAYSPKYSKNTSTAYTHFDDTGTAHYDVTISNNSNKQYEVSKITIEDDSDDQCFLDGLSEGDIIEPGTNKTFSTVVLSSGNVTRKKSDVSNTCKVYYEFTEYVPVPIEGENTFLYEKAIKDNGGKEAIEAKGQPDFASIPTDENSGMYAATENSGKSYYYRGNVKNNFVYYDNKYWRIIRVTDDNSVRMIYQGTTPDATGTDATTGSTSQFINVSGSKSSSAASPYKNVYGPSTAASNINTFYKNNLATGESKYSLTTQYCNDVTDTSGAAKVSASTIFGDVTSSVTYAAYRTRYSNATPTFTCPAKAYKYAVIGGTQTLTNPVAMINMDEVMYAGGNSSANADYYLNIGVAYWIMTPYQYSYAIGIKTSSVFIVKADGSLGGDLVQNSHYLRPVVTLNSDTIWGGGNGTVDTPYTIGDGNASVTIDPTPYKNSTLASTVQSVCEAGDTSVYHHTSSLANSAGDNSYRYSGANPNNYVCFGSGATKCPNENLYRIIGVIDGKVKLITADYATVNMLGTDYGYIGTTSASTNSYVGMEVGTIPTYAYNNKDGSNSNNNWDDSPLAVYNLNTNFINSFSSEWQNKIVTTTWKVGYVRYWDAIATNAAGVYPMEIGNPETYNAKIGLMYAHEYGFATSPLFWTKHMDSYSNTYVKNNNWMVLGLKEWFISHGNAFNYTNFASAIAANAGITYDYVYNGLSVRPVFSIDAGVKYTGGNGTRDDPMRLS